MKQAGAAEKSSLSAILTSQIAAQSDANALDAVRDGAIGLLEVFVSAETEGDGDADALADAVAQRIQQHASKVGHRSYWIFWLLDAYKAHRWARGCAEPTQLAAAVDARAVEHSSGYPAVLRALSLNDLRTAARRAFPSGRHVTVELLPAAANDDPPVPTHAEPPCESASRIYVSAVA